MVLFAVSHLDRRDDTVLSRKNAAILKLTHEGCPTCKGLGQIYTKDKKTGAFTGAKRCPAKPTKQHVSKWAVYKASRFGPDKSTGLLGWACPCGKKEKPRYRDAKAATAGLRAHERQKHGGSSVGGAWYAQVSEEAKQAADPQREPMPSKVVADSGMTDQQWIKKNKGMPVGKAIAAGKCWKCSGDGKLHAVFGDEQILVVCPECKGSGKPAVATAS
ncbi:hypothetical protein ADK57_25915 [Streptomyces sp. MMG1533]|nr:hypothetical protein ADK57_25915 [Streptomyces sp. MMG1533]